MDYIEFSANFLDAMRNCSLEQFADEKNVRIFFNLTERLLAFNAHTNLTAITDTEDIIVKHYADSLTLCDAVGTERQKLIDVGCGAGFPSLPLALTMPELRVTSLDSTAKKLAFISQTSDFFEMHNISVLCARAEDIAASKNSSFKGNASLYREKYDIACARAVAPLRVLSEYCLPLVRTGGKFIAMKGASAMTEIDEARTAIASLGGEIVECRESFLSLRGEVLKHYVIIIQKTAPTPIIYPRANPIITKNPL